MIAPKGADNYQLRFPDGLRDRLRERADLNGRSMNTEIIAAIEEHLERGTLFEQLVARVERLERRVNQPVGGRRE